MLLGGHCDCQCKDPSRLYYEPSCPQEGAASAFFESNDGKLLDPDFLIGLSRKSTPQQVATLSKRDPGAATPDLMLLKGRRLALASELEENGRFAEAAIKSMTGGDTMQARDPYGLFASWTPTHKLMPAPIPSPLKQRFLDWFTSLPEFTRDRPFSMTEFEIALGSRGRFISPVLLALGWQRKRRWSSRGQYHRYWIPPHMSACGRSKPTKPKKQQTKTA